LEKKIVFSHVLEGDGCCDWNNVQGRGALEWNHRETCSAAFGEGTSKVSGVVKHKIFIFLFLIYKLFYMTSL